MSLIVRSVCILSLPLVCVFAGCGGSDDSPDRYTLEGSITFDGQPIPAGTITLIPDSKKGNQGPAGSGKIKDGKYTTADGGTGIIGGPHIVRVSGFDGNAKPEEELPMGSPLFPEYEYQYDFPAFENEGPVSVDLKVPKEAATRKPQQRPQDAV